MSRRFGIWGGAGLLVIGLLLGLFVTGPEPTALDRWWHGVVSGARSPLLVDAARVPDVLGGGPVGVLVVPTILALLVLWRRGWRSACFAVATFCVSAAIVQGAKHLLSRTRPEDMLVASDHGSFPSGHTANAATVAVVLWLLAPHLIVAILGGAWVLVMAASRTVVSAHWLTDTLGGALVGAGAALLVAAVLLDWSTRRRDPRERPAGELTREDDAQRRAAADPPHAG